MIHRTTLAVIIIFWLVMVALLVRMEFFSGDGELMPVPADFVMKLMFRHEQLANLVPYSQHHRLDGELHLQPRYLAEGPDGHGAPANVLNGNGNFAVNLPGLNAQRIILRGLVEMDGREQLRRVELTASLHEMKQTSPGLTVFLEGWPARDKWRYEVRQGGMTLREGHGPMSELLAAFDPHLPGLDLRGIEQFQRQQAAATRIMAHRGLLKLNGEEIETYVLSIKQGETVEATIHFSQLGQILAVKTFAGYDLYDEGLAP